jgi:N-acetylglucosamine-6-phosphate deacetylase
MVPDRSAFASSITPVDQMVRNLIRYTGIPSLDAINMATANIARMMGCFDRKGSIAPGKDADIETPRRGIYKNLRDSHHTRLHLWKI